MESLEHMQGMPVSCLWRMAASRLCLKELAIVFSSVSNGKFWFNCLGTHPLLTNNGSMIMYSSWHLMISWLLYWYLEFLLLGFGILSNWDSWRAFSFSWLQEMNRNDESFVILVCAAISDNVVGKEIRRIIANSYENDRNTVTAYICSAFCFFLTARL